MSNKNKSRVARYIHDEKYITVTDDWYPCYNDNKVKLKIHLICYCPPTSDGYTGSVSLQAWGADDTYVSKDFYVRYDGAKYNEFEDVHGKPELVNQYIDDTNATYIDNLKLMYMTWKRDIFDNIPNGVNRKWFLENGFSNGI